VWLETELADGRLFIAGDSFYRMTASPLGDFVKRSAILDT
jgi:hypothetical protein